MAVTITMRTYNFVDNRRGSLHELIDHLLVAEECEYINNLECDESIDEVKAAIAVLNGYIKYLKKQKDSKSQ